MDAGSSSGTSRAVADEKDEFVEVDPTGRYGRYNDVLGKGAFKTVYKAFDEGEGIEVAWNQVKLADVLQKSDDLERLYSEVHLLKTLKHKNIIKFYSSWVDTKNDNINFITEVFTSGTLRQYRKKHKHVDLRALKNWSRQILCGLLYLHSHDPPVIHRDLKCDNIFVNGNQGEVKIGDLGLAAILRHRHSAHSVIGTPEFMAPELYEEEYNELVDIYAFGMCLLELVTFEYPYSECSNAAQIYKKVTSGIKPASLAKINDPGIKQFIEKCIASASERLSARELLRDPFLQIESEIDVSSHSASPELIEFDNADATTATIETEHEAAIADEETVVDVDVVSNGLEPSTSGIDCTVEGQRRDINTIFLKLRFADSTDRTHNIHFPFDIEADTSMSVAAEMVSELDLTNQDVTTIADMIDSEIQAHFPHWVSGTFDEEDQDNENLSEGEDFEDEDKDEVEDEGGIQALPIDHHYSGNLVLERLPSGRRYWSDSAKGSNSLSLPHMLDLNSNDNGKAFEITGASTSMNPCECNNYARGNPCLSSCEVQKAPLNCTNLSGNGSNAYEYAVLKLQELLVKQQKELDDLRRSHDLAIIDMLKELPLELKNSVCSACRLNFGLHNAIQE